MFFLLSLNLVVAWPVRAQAPIGPKPDSAYWASIQTQVNALSPSYVSKTTMLNPYRIFAIQHRKDWLLVVSDSLGFDSYLKLHKIDSLHQNSLFFDSNLGALLGQYIQPSPKPRPVNLGEITFENFYEVLREGRDFFEQIVKIETGKKYPGFLAKAAQVVAWPAKALLGLEKITALKETVDAQKKAIEAQKQKLEELAQLNQDLSAQLKALKEMEAALEAAQSQTWPDDRPPSPRVGVPVDTSRQTNPLPAVSDSTTTRPDSTQALPGDTVQTRPVSDSLGLSADSLARPLPADTLPRIPQADWLPELSSMNTEDSLQMAKNKKLKEIQTESGKQAQTNTEEEYPLPMSDWKKQEQALLKEKEALSEALAQNPDLPEAATQRDRIIEIDNQLKILLNDMRKWLEGQKKILSP